jgi:hypothetical protein
MGSLRPSGGFHLRIICYNRLRLEKACSVNSVSIDLRN